MAPGWELSGWNVLIHRTSTTRLDVQISMSWQGSFALVLVQLNLRHPQWKP